MKLILYMRTIIKFLRKLIVVNVTYMLKFYVLTLLFSCIFIAILILNLAGEYRIQNVNYVFLKTVYVIILIISMVIRISYTFHTL